MASIDNNDALVNRVLDLSLDAVSRSGLDGFSIRNIASEAGCSVTPISRRFETKADLLLAVQNHAYGEELKFHPNLAAELESMPLSYENLVEVLILYIDFYDSLNYLITTIVLLFDSLQNHFCQN